MERIISKVVQDNFDKIAPYNLQLFHNDKPQWESAPPEPVGTGVLIKFENNYFIVTAAHVLQPYATKQKRNPYKEESDYDDPQEAFLTLENIGFYYDDAYYPIREVVFTNIDGKVENLVDIAAVNLEKETVEELSGKQFVDCDMLELNHTISTQNRYFVYGFPAEWTDLKSDKIVSKSFKLITRGIDVPSDGIEDLEFDTQYNILIFYDHKNLVSENDNELNLSSPNGISGCGLWYYENAGMLKLIGIMTENKFEKERKPFMMATKIDVVIDILKYAVTNIHKC